MSFITALSGVAR